MAIWVRWPDDDRWHAAAPSGAGARSSQCGRTIDTDAVGRPPGDDPASWERCFECDAQVVMSQRRRRLLEALRADQLEVALRHYRGE